MSGKCTCMSFLAQRRVPKACSSRLASTATASSRTAPEQSDGQQRRERFRGSPLHIPLQVSNYLKEDEIPMAEEVFRTKQQYTRTPQLTARQMYYDADDKPIRPRIGLAAKEYLKLSAQEKIKSDLKRERLYQSMAPARAYAIEQEQEKLMSVDFSHLKRDNEEVQRLQKVAEAVKAPNLDDIKARVQARLKSFERNPNQRRQENALPTTNVVPTVKNHPSGAESSDRRPRNAMGAESIDRRPRQQNVRTVNSVDRKGRLQKHGYPENSAELNSARITNQVKPVSTKRASPPQLRKVILPSSIRVQNLATKLGKTGLWSVQKAMSRLGYENNTPDRILTADDASLIALELNYDPVIDDESAFDIFPDSEPSDTSKLPLRAPITGIFGHVDHGKTSLLDALRSTAVAAGEAGGITQHIGAFEVSVSTMVRNLKKRAAERMGQPVSEALQQPAEDAGEGGMVTFLDTPGHAAFSAMRERGTSVTDVVILVVAADDGVKPQTEEVIKLIKGSDVGLVVALTKVDKPGIDVDLVKRGLMVAGIEVEGMGGEIPCVEVSSLTGQGLADLLETISALAEIRELKADREGRAHGTVIESKMEKGKGNVATVLVQRGCLVVGTKLVAGTSYAHVRTLTSSMGKNVEKVFPGQPVEISGWRSLPAAGDVVLETSSESEAKHAIRNRLKKIEQDKLWEDVDIINDKRETASQLEEFRKEEIRQARANGMKREQARQSAEKAANDMAKSHAPIEPAELLLIVKGDVSGTVEAVVGAIGNIGNKEAKVKIVQSDVGALTASDVEMAKAIGAEIVAFNVPCPGNVKSLAARSPAVLIHSSAVIYRLVEIIREAVIKKLPKDIRIKVLGEALVQQLFEISVKGRKEPLVIAGSKVFNGNFARTRMARVVRNEEFLFTGEVSTLKQVKKDVVEVSKGTECGIAIEGFESFQEGDTIQSVEEYEVKRTL